MKYQSPKTSILVLGSSELIGNCYCPLKQSVYHYTIRFFANAMDYLTAEEGFSDIRNRRVTARYIDPAFCEKPYKDILKITGTLGGALMVIVLGLYLGFKRRADQKREVVL